MRQNGERQKILSTLKLMATTTYNNDTNNNKLEVMFYVNVFCVQKNKDTQAQMSHFNSHPRVSESASSQICIPVESSSEIVTMFLVLLSPMQHSGSFPVKTLTDTKICTPKPKSKAPFICATTEL